MSVRVIRLAAGSAYQDEGRPGWRHFGVPPGGAFDRESHRLAVALVGKSEGTTLELPMLGGVFECIEDDFVAVVGADGRLELNGKLIRTNAAIPLQRGARLSILPSDRGVRVYLASARGWNVEDPLGSASGVEPNRILKTSSTIDNLNRQVRRLGFWPDSLRERPLRFVPGPQARRQDLTSLASVSFQVGLASNRVGIRLEGGRFEPATEIPSEPSCFGAVQLAPSGELLIHGPDGPTIGGYPKIAVVIGADHDRLGQLRPQDEVTFEQVSLEDAVELRKREEARLDKWIGEIRLAG